MKKYIALISSIITISFLAACSKRDNYEIKITIPAGSTETIVYSEEEISPKGDTIIISAGEGLSDTEVVLKPVEVKEENAYEPAYLTPGMPVKMDAEKGAWFKIGVAVQNPSDVDIVVTVEVEDIEVRIGDKAANIFQAQIIEIKDSYFLVEPVEGSQELKSADQIEIPMQNMDASKEPQVGDIIEISYNGEILEINPARLSEVYSIRVVEQTE